MKQSTHKGYLNFSAKERIGVISLLAIIALAWACRFLYKNYILAKESPVVYKNEISALQSYKRDSSLATKNNDAYDDNERPYMQNDYSAEPSAPGQLFTFDPNTLSTEGWIKLGLREKTAHTIQNYIAKGGKFRQPEDIKKIWGLNEALANKLIPYVRIEDNAAAPYGENNNRFAQSDATNYKPYEKKIVQPIDLNSADTSALINLPGIGAGYAKRIIKFRDVLGGFVSVNQVAETYGLPDSTFQTIKQYLKASGTPLRKININTASAKEMKHPYISYQVANAIISYRTQHGNFASVSDIKKVLAVTEDIYQKASPYLTVE